MWFEFDNDTEKDEEIENKMKRYIHTLLMAKNRNAVLLVTPTEKRAKVLEGCWERVQADPFYAPFTFPKEGTG